MSTWPEAVEAVKGHFVAQEATIKAHEATIVEKTTQLAEAQKQIAVLGKELSLSVYALPLQPPADVLALLKKYLVRPDDMVPFMRPVIPQLPGITHVIGGANLADVQNGANNAASLGAKWVGYNIEEGKRANGEWFSPQAETADPVAAMAEASRIIRAENLKFMFNPGGSLLWDRFGTIKREWYKEYDWSKADMVLMQFQGLIYGGTDVQAFYNTMKTVTDFIRARNPSVKIFEQLSLRFDLPDLIIKKTHAIKHLVDGVTYFFQTDTAKCPNCSIQNFATILSALRPAL
jgi:hypothetical protein